MCILLTPAEAERERTLKINQKKRMRGHIQSIFGQTNDKSEVYVARPEIQDEVGGV
jgi:hypothetical protein